MVQILRLNFLLLVFFAFITGCKPDKTYDLAIKNVTVLDVQTGVLQANKTILITNGIIEQIISADKDFISKEVIEGNNKLVTPSFIDTHIHPSDVLGDYENAPKTLDKDSLSIYRKRLSDVYLPYGVTTVLSMGQSDKWLDPTLQWQNNSVDSLVDYYIAGGALISKDNREPYFAHTEVTSPQLARKKITQYHNKGLKYVKIYYRLKEPEFTTVIKTADSLNMKLFGHIGDFDTDYLAIDYALQKGINNFEHIPLIGNNFFKSQQERDSFDTQFVQNFGEFNSEIRLIEYFLDQFRFIEENKRNEKASFLNTLAKEKITISTTIHRLYEQIAPTYFTTPNDSLMTKSEAEKNLHNFKLMMDFAKQLHDNGVELRIGTDMPNGGKVLISELIILANYGFSIADVFKIATINGAKALQLDTQTGSIDIGKKANIIIWSESPFDNINNFSKPIKVIKDGRLLD